MYISIHVHVYAYMNVRVHVYVYVYILEYIHMYTFICIRYIHVDMLVFKYASSITSSKEAGMMRMRVSYP